MAYNLRRSSHGGDRRHNRSLAETLAYGNERYGDEGWSPGPSNTTPEPDELYDESAGPRDMTRRPNTEEWGERAEGYRVFSGDADDAEQVRMVFAANENRSTGGKGKVIFTNWDEPEEVDEKWEREAYDKKMKDDY